MRLTVARIGRAHGIRGEVSVEVRTDVPERRFVPGAEFTVAALDAAAPASLVLRAARNHNGVLLLRFRGIDDRTAAEALRGALLETEVDVHAECADEPDAWFDHQLVGLAAVDPAGRALGEVIAVEHAGAQDRLVVRRPDGATRLVPFVTAIVPTVDVTGGHVVLDAPGGLLDDLPDQLPDRDEG